eukprot:m.45201 g.45201  ORF g.45201 m.45201 type:complete len:382 (-) comp10655_c1_seq1:1353-2498(-)
MSFHHVEDAGVLYANFNQDASRLSVGTMEGYQLFKCKKDLQRICSCDDEGTNIVNIYYNTGLIAHVGDGNNADSTQRLVKITNVRTDKEIVRLQYRAKVLAVRLNRKFLVVVTENTIYIYEMASMKQTHTISDTPSNPNGVVALANCHSDSDTDECRHLLCYPKAHDKGQLFVYDIDNHRLLSMIDAHNSPVSRVALNNTGELLATASMKGTVFRVFATHTKQKLYELRRGYSTRAFIMSMSFSADSKFLCVSSEKATVHVFQTDRHNPAALVPAQQEAEEKKEQTWGSYLYDTMSTTVSSAVDMIAPGVSELWTEERSFAQASIETACENVSAVVKTSLGYVLMVITAHGDFYKFLIKDDGSCEELMRKNIFTAEKQEEG